MSKKILVVDDEPDITRLVEFTLKKRGFEVLVAGDGFSGVEIAKKERPDLILMDIMMPGMNGYEACRCLKAEAETKSIPILALSAKTQRSEVEEVLRNGADGFISKPFTPSELVEKVKGVFET